MSAPPLESSFFYRMATSLNKAWADWFTALGATQSGLGTMATQNANNVAITGGAISGITDVAVADGGTGASTAATARTNLGAAGLADANVFTQQNTFSAAGIVLPTGTFTPTLVSSGGGVPTYGAQTGTYTVVGDRCIFSLTLTITAYNTLAAGSLTIGGMPFTAAGGTSDGSPVSVSADNLAATAATDIHAYIIGGNSVVTLARFSGGARNALAKVDTSATAQFRIGGAYRV